MNRPETSEESRPREKNSVLRRGELHLVKCRFSRSLPKGRYVLTVGTRGGNGPGYRLRTVRHTVEVI